MHELLAWILSFFFTFEITQALFDQYLVAFAVSAAMVGFSSPCLTVLRSQIGGVKLAREVYYFYQDQLVFLVGTLETVEILSLVVVSLSAGSTLIGRAVFLWLSSFFQSFDSLGSLVALVLTVLATTIVAPAISLLYRLTLLFLITDKRLARLSKTHFDSVVASKRFGLKDSGFIVRDYCTTVRWSFTHYYHSRLLAFRRGSFVMPITCPSVSVLSWPLTNVGRDRLKLFVHYSAKSLCWAALAVGVVWLQLQSSLVSLVSMSAAFCASNAVASLWWLLTDDPFGKVYSGVRPTYRTLARPTYKALSVIEEHGYEL